MITYQAESFWECQADLEPLFKLHWEEIARNKETIKLAVDWEKYCDLEDLGILHLTTVRDEGKLVGYIMTLVSPHLHYRDNIFAKVDILFVHSDYRGAGIFSTLLGYTEAYIKGQGAENLYVGMKLTHDFGKLLERKGYTPTERIFEKRI